MHAEQERVTGHGNLASMADSNLRILLAGYFGFDNAGDEAIFEAIVENLRRLSPGVQLKALVHDPETAHRLEVEPIPRKEIPQVWSALRNSDLFLLGGGGLFQDVTGPGSVFYYGGLLGMAKLAGCPSVFFCQGYGPVRRPLQKLFTRQILRLPTLLTVRDEESRTEMRQLGVSEESIFLAADPALLLSPLPPDELRAILGEEDLFKELGRSELPNGQLSQAGPLVAVTVRPWPGLDLQELAKALVEFRGETSARYLLFPFQPERDLKPSVELSKLLEGEARVLDRPLTPRALSGILACCDMVIGMRLHSLILATVGNPPLYGLSYDPKVERFCRRAGALSCLIEEISSDRLLREWKHLLQGRKAQRKCQEKAVEIMRKEAEAAFLASLAVGRGAPSQEVVNHFQNGS